MDERYLTFNEAAALAGYRNLSSLHAAARGGRLKTVHLGPHAHATTRAWLEAYLATVRGGSYGRGQDQGERARTQAVDK